MQPTINASKKHGRRVLTRAEKPDEKRPNPEIAAEAVKRANQAQSAKASELPPQARLNPRGEPKPSTRYEAASIPEPASAMSTQQAQAEGQRIARKFANSGQLPGRGLQAAHEAESSFAKEVERLCSMGKLGPAAIATFGWMQAEIGNAADQYVNKRKEPTGTLDTWRARAGNTLIERLWAKELNKLHEPPKQAEDADQ